MGSSDTSAPSPAPEDFLRIFRTREDAGGAMTFARFMELALYDPAVGYYRHPRTRVGYGQGTDFFTASTSAPLFGELIAAACIDLLRKENPRDYAFVEIGAEPARGVMSGVSHPFGSVRAAGVGEALDLRGRCVVFSNELFDAQPFRRFVFRGGAWREFGVTLRGGRLAMVELPEAAPATLPPAAVEGQLFDAPTGAAALTAEIAAQPWVGLFVACDYGRTFRELAENYPAGTARAYHRHAQSNDLLARPGEQDLTCHICWDWLTEILSARGFSAVTLESQEAFLVHHAATLLAKLTAAEAERLSPKKRSLLQLLHPAHLGQKFQVLHAFRGEIPG
ncbi:MAG TPA: SAM-dependent methyltransferase [Opitutaceae bacterium]|nr:SAM-dependent methyltransferase [Opitutaceae bacterium]